MNWQTELLRFTTFLPSGRSDDPNLPDWQAVMRRPPETTSTKQGGTIHEELGTYADQTNLRRVKRPGRVDWLLGFAGSGHQPFPSIGDFAESANQFLPLAGRAIGTKVSIGRLAFGAKLTIEVESASRGTTEIRKRLGFLHDLPKDASDLALTINLKRPSVVGPKGLKINRITKWSLSQVARVTIQAGEMNIGSQASDTRFGVELELDINTAADFGKPFGARRSKSIFRELVDFGLEVAKDGLMP